MTTGTAFTEERERKNLLLLMNPRAGTMQASKYLSEIVQMYSDAGYLTTVLMTREQGDGRRFAMRYAAAADIVVVAGGDGTLNGVLDGLISSGVDVPVGYIPSGSTNDFAAGIGLPKSIPAAAERIVTGTPKTFDLGSFNGRHFS